MSVVGVSWVFSGCSRTVPGWMCRSGVGGGATLLRESDGSAKRGEAGARGNDSNARRRSRRTNGKA